MKHLIKEFFQKVGDAEIEIYNEFSLQHELGIFLRDCPRLDDCKVQFERNASYFGLDKNKFEKKEIDISIFSDEISKLCVMELKYPRNGQYPESMFGFCKDIKFLEQLVNEGFKSAYFVAVADDHLFYSGNDKGIYGLFRNGQPITGEIKKPTGPKDKSVHIKGLYVAEWLKVVGSTKYCLIEVS